MASAARRTVPPLRGYDSVIVYRASPQSLGSQLLSWHRFFSKVLPVFKALEGEI
jgi:hypothetical protein